MSVENSRRVMDAYYSANYDVTPYLAEDVVYTVMGTGEQAKGPAAVVELQRRFYNVHFKASARPTNLFIGENGAVLEARVVGTHTGEYAGVPATGKEIDVPMCVVYDIEGAVISRGRIYFEVAAFLRQVGAGVGKSSQG